jgi:hypothetical protein
MNRVNSNVLVQVDGRLRASVYVDNEEVNHMTFRSDESREANRWVKDAVEYERECLKKGIR